MDDTISKVPILVETLASKYNLSPSFSTLNFIVVGLRIASLIPMCTSDRFFVVRCGDERRSCMICLD